MVSLNRPRVVSFTGAYMKTAAYTGKKVVIAVVGANSGGRSLVELLDSVQTATANLQVVVVPTSDFGASTASQDIAALRQNTSIVFTQPLLVTKASAALQHPMFAWLTHAADNSHFDMDVEGEGQLFIVSPQGSLSAVVSKQTAREDVIMAIEQAYAE